VVTFHSRIRSASAFARTLPEVRDWMPEDRRPGGTLWAEHVSGEMTSGERDNRLNRLRKLAASERGVLTNARCLAEGVDVPTLDGVAFIEPRRSQVDVVQAVGRAIRKAEDKSFGTVVIPVFVDEGDDPELALDSSEFSRVWGIVKALRAHDDALAEELDQLRRELGRRATSVGRPGKIKLDLPVGVGGAFVRAFDAQLVTQTSASREFYFGLLLAYVEREGHARVPFTHIETGRKLGLWVFNLRRRHRKGELPSDLISRLEALPSWSWHAKRDAWERGFHFLERFIGQTGDARVPSEHTEDGFRLGAWVKEQRRLKSEGNLSTERVTRLEALPGWSWSPRSEKWTIGFEHLRRFADREGHARVPSIWQEDGYNLSGWVKNQRAFFARGGLEPARISLLESLAGWVWGPHADRWENGFSYLELYVAREHHARVPQGHVEDGYKLGGWVPEQRTKFRAGLLPPARAARLNALPGWVWVARGAAGS
jgi:hypothetical protein